jgi:hypothetical protein
VARGQAAAVAGVAMSNVWWQRSSSAAALQPLWWGVRRAACPTLKTVGGDEAGVQGLDCGLHGGGHGGTASCSGKSPALLFWLWRLAWLGRGGPRCFVATECERRAPCWSCKGSMGVTPAPSESSFRPLPVPAKATSCGVEFPVKGVAVVSVCARWSSSGRSASLSLPLVIGSVRWCLSLSVE